MIAEPTHVLVLTEEDRLIDDESRALGQAEMANLFLAYPEIPVALDDGRMGQVVAIGHDCIMVTAYRGNDPEPLVIPTRNVVHMGKGSLRASLRGVKTRYKRPARLTREQELLRLALSARLK